MKSLPELADDADKIAEFATQEALGEIPLEENLYLASNVIDIIDLTEDDFRLKFKFAAKESCRPLF